MEQSATMSIMTVFVTFGIGYYFSYDPDDVEGIFGGAVAFSSFLILDSFLYEYGIW